MDRKHFFIFAILDQPTAAFITDPIMIANFIGEPVDHLAVRILPWRDRGTLDFNGGASLEAFATAASDVVEAIGERDPYIADEFGIEGTGEGLVYVPRGITAADVLAGAAFKVKSEAHRVRKTKAAASADFQLPDSIAELAASFVTPARCEQALREIGGATERPLMGDFLKWVGGDIKKESAGELEAAGADWKKVSGIVSKHAAAWFLRGARRCGMRRKLSIEKEAASLMPLNPAPQVAAEIMRAVREARGLPAEATILKLPTQNRKDSQ